MIYLFGTGSFRGNEKIVKVGFTDDKEEREKAYLLHNPKGEFLGWRQGDKLMETKLHLRLKDFKQDFLDEWFYYEPEVEEIFGLPASGNQGSKNTLFLNMVRQKEYQAGQVLKRQKKTSSHSPHQKHLKE